MKSLILYLTILIFATFWLSSCGNKVEVPSEIHSQVDVKESTQTVNVVHTVGISLEMTQLFESTCIAQIDSQNPRPPEPLRSEMIKLCVSEATQKFIESILAIINQDTPPQP